MTKSSNEPISPTGFFWVKQQGRDWTIARFTGVKWLGDVVEIDGITQFEHIGPKLERGQSQSDWQPIETAPRQKVILLWAITSNNPVNWKMATGHCAISFDHPYNLEWTWEGRLLMKYDVKPTHWMPLPEPPCR